MKRLLAIALLLLTACVDAPSKIDFKGVEVVSVEGEEYPSSAELRLDIDNHAGAFTLSQCRLRFGIEQRKQVVATLAERVKVGCGRQSVVLRMRLSIVHNSLTMRLREMLSRCDVSQIEVDGEYLVRRGLFSRRGQIASTPITELLSQEDLEPLWEIIEENKK